MSSQPEQRPEDSSEHDPLIANESVILPQEFPSNPEPIGEWTAETGQFPGTHEAHYDESLPTIEHDGLQNVHDDGPPLFQAWFRPELPKIERIPYFAPDCWPVLLFAGIFSVFPPSAKRRTKFISHSAPRGCST